jgi:hypothetical protein
MTVVGLARAEAPPAPLFPAAVSTEGHIVRHGLEFNLAAAFVRPPSDGVNRSLRVIAQGYVPAALGTGQLALLSRKHLANLKRKAGLEPLRVEIAGQPFFSELLNLLECGA